MMGKALLTPDVPVTKGTSGILLLSREESERKPMEPLYPLRQMRECLSDGTQSCVSR